MAGEHAGPSVKERQFKRPQRTRDQLPRSNSGTRSTSNGTPPPVDTREGETPVSLELSEKLAARKNELAYGVGEVGRTAINGERRKAVAAYEDASKSFRPGHVDDDSREWEAKNRGESALFQHAAVGGLTEETIAEGPHALDTVGDRKIIYAKPVEGDPEAKGPEGNIRKITAVADDTLTCEVVLEDGKTTESWDIPREDVQAALLAGEKEHILALEGFQGENGKAVANIVSTYIDNPELIGVTEADMAKLSPDLKAARDEIGLGALSGEAARAQVEKTLPDYSTVTRTPENVADINYKQQLRQELLAAIGDSEVISPELWVRVYGHDAKARADQFAIDIPKMEQAAQAAKGGERKTLSRQVIDAVVDQRMCAALATKTGQEEAIAALTALTDGIVTPEQVKHAAALTNAVITGQVETAIGELRATDRDAIDKELNKNLRMKEGKEATLHWIKILALAAVLAGQGFSMAGGIVEE